MIMGIRFYGLIIAACLGFPGLINAQPQLGDLPTAASDSARNQVLQAAQDTLENRIEGAEFKEGVPNFEDSLALMTYKEHVEANIRHEPPIWSIIPFLLLLAMIATGPVLFYKFWHHYFPHICVALAAVVVLFYLGFLGNHHDPLHALSEYLSFVALLTPLYIASGGIHIRVDREGTPLANTLLLLFGSVIANIIGTTGASMLLIRPFMRLNQQRIAPYHIVFFIFMVSNVGGALTPIGDPPLFLGFLKGIPFTWTLIHIWPAWLVSLGLLAVIFYFLDRENHKQTSTERHQYTGHITLRGTRNFIYLGLVIALVFLDPGIYAWVPAIHVDGMRLSFLRELGMLTIAALAYRTANQAILKDNDFNLEPIKEVVFLFIGIFGTMMPALHLIGIWASGPGGEQYINLHTLFWGTGILSGFLDNAPTYLNFLAASMAKEGMDIAWKFEVLNYAAQHVRDLLAISVAAVFFGAFTYIGNGPNFMVKALAEHAGIKMPTFFQYITRYSLRYLLPVLLVVYLIFFWL